MKAIDSDHYNSRAMLRTTSNHKKSTTLSQKIEQLWESITEILLRQEQPKVYVKQNRFGNTYWKVHDPLNRQTPKYFDTEQEVRSWLDKRFYS